MAQIPLSKGYYALVDDEDVEAINSIGSWTFSAGYAIHWYTDLSGKRRRLWLHRFVAERMFGRITGTQVDHISGGQLGMKARLDNRRENLRLASRNQQQANKGPQINSTSGFKGITLRAGRYEVRMRHEGQRLYLGRYDSLYTAWTVYGLAHRLAWRFFSTENDVPEPSPELRAYVLSKLLAQGVDVDLAPHQP